MGLPQAVYAVRLFGCQGTAGRRHRADRRPLPTSHHHS